MTAIATTTENPFKAGDVVTFVSGKDWKGLTGTVESVNGPKTVCVVGDWGFHPHARVAMLALAAGIPA